MVSFVSMFFLSFFSVLYTLYFWKFQQIAKPCVYVANDFVLAHLQLTKCVWMEMYIKAHTSTHTHLTTQRKGVSSRSS